MSNTLPEKFKFLYSSKWLSWTIIFIAIVVRLIEYLNNRSLFWDEGAIALPIINRTFSELFYPLEGQSAPFGFLIIEKLIVQLLGTSDYTFRLFPFLCGIISPILFYKIATHYIKPKAIPIALGLFAVSDRLIYYSATVKQYSSDVAIALLLFIAAIYIQSRKLTISRFVLFGMLGAIVIWFSQPSVFILAGLGICLALFSFIERDYKKIWKLSITYFIWTASFAIIAFFYVLYHRDSSTYVFLQNWWNHAFMPFPPWSFSSVRWFIDTFINMGIFLVIGEWWNMLQPYASLPKLVISVITMLLFYVGCISMFFEKKKEFFMLISPMFFALLASGLHLFPFADRVILFLIPFMFLLIAEGVEQISDKIMRNSVINRVILLLILFGYPLQSAFYHLEHTRSKHNDIRQVVDYIVRNQKNGDLVYFRVVAVPGICEYYSEVYGLKNTGCLYLITDENDLLSDLSTLKEKGRVWVIFPTHYNLERDALSYLDSIGTRLENFISKQGVSVYLYDIR